MRQTLSFAFAAAAAGSLLIAGCSGGQQAATIPQTSPGSESQVTTPAPAPAPLVTAPSSGSSLSGIYELQLDLAQATPRGKLAPIRFQQAAGDDFAVDITNFLQLSPCSDCVELRSVRSGSGPNTFEVDIAVRHPFPLPTPPLGAFDRYDLHAFDVMGYLLNEGDGTPLTFGSVSIADPFLMNADGYSDLLDGVTEPYFSTASVTDHPYKLFFEDGTAGNFDAGTHGFADFINPTGHNVMPQGSDWSVATYELQLDPANPLRFAFAVSVAWGQAVTGRGAEPGQRQQPIYYLPEFHHKAPWKVTAEVTANGLFGGDTGSNATLEIRLRDWQLGATVDPGWEWMTSDRDSISAVSDVASIQITAPGLEVTPVNVDPLSGAGTGVFEDQVFTASVFNSAAAASGTFYAWIQATDSLSPGPMDVIDRLIGFNTISDFHTGTVVELPIVGGGSPPTAVLAPNPVDLACNTMVTLDASASSDPEDGMSLTYEFDLDLTGGDPLNFSVDVGPQALPTHMHTFTLPYPTHVAVRVTDSQLNTDIAVVPITNDVISFGAPVTISPFTSGWVQKGNHERELGGSSVAAAGDWVFYASPSYQSSNRGPTSEVRVWRTNDGVSWETLTPIDASNAFRDLIEDYAIAAAPDGNVYVIFSVPASSSTLGPFETRVAASGNFGTNAWSVVSTLLEPSRPDWHNLWVDPIDSMTVLGFTARNQNTWTSFRSNNGAAGPFTTGTAITAELHGLEILDHPSGDILAIGLEPFSDQLRTYRSTDNGATFPLNSGFGVTAFGTFANSGAAAVDPTDLSGDTILFIARIRDETNLRSYRTTNAGTAWTLTSTTLQVADISQVGWPTLVDVDFDSGGKAFVTTYSPITSSDHRGRVQYTDDLGDTWSTEEEIFWNGPGFPSWPGFDTVLMNDGCTMITCYTEQQNLRSRTF